MNVAHLLIMLACTGGTLIGFTHAESVIADKLVEASDGTVTLELEPSN